MKAKEIKIGERYAVKVFGYLQEARVVSIGQHERRVYSGHRSDFSGHRATQLMVEVQRPSRVHDRDGAVPPTDWVLPQQVETEWAEYYAAQHRAQLRAETTDQVYTDIETRLAALDVPYVHIARTNHPGGRSAGVATISATSLKRLVELAEKGARA